MTHFFKKKSNKPFLTSNFGWGYQNTLSYMWKSSFVLLSSISLELTQFHLVGVPLAQSHLVGVTLVQFRLISQSCLVSQLHNYCSHSYPYLVALLHLSWCRLVLEKCTKEKEEDAIGRWKGMWSWKKKDKRKTSINKGVVIS